MHQIVIIFFVLVAFLCEHCNGSVSEKPSEHICYVEVGNSRIKAAILPLEPTLEDLRKVKVITTSSAPWKQHNLQQLFTQSRATPFYDLLISDFSKISLSISGPIYDSSILAFGKEEKGPENLKELIESATQTAANAENDAVSWAVGALEYLKLNSQTVQFPCLAVTLGTGIGVAFIEDATTVTSIEIWHKPCPYPKLKDLSQEKLPTEVLYKRYLDKLFGGEEHVEFGMNKRFQTFVEDLIACLEELVSGSISSVLVGGGYSTFIDSLEKTHQTVLCLNSQL